MVEVEVAEHHHVDILMLETGFAQESISTCWLSCTP